jgi:hypothetical protein
MTMIKRIPISVLVINLFANVCIAEVEGSQMITNWGENINGAQLSIGVSNNIVRAGSTTVFYTRTKNSSTNLIRIIPQFIASYTLTNNSGKTYHAVPVMLKRLDVITANPALNLDVSPGEIREWSVLIQFDQDMELGEYLFSPITEDITTVDNKVCTLISNSPKVRIK